MQDEQAMVRCNTVLVPGLFFWLCCHPHLLPVSAYLHRCLFFCTHQSRPALCYSVKNKHVERKESSYWAADLQSTQMHEWGPEPRLAHKAHPLSSLTSRLMIPPRASLPLHNPERTQMSRARPYPGSPWLVNSAQIHYCSGKPFGPSYSNRFLTEQPSFLSHLNPFTEGHLCARWESNLARSQPPLTGSLQDLRAKVLNSPSVLSAAAAQSTESALSAVQDPPRTHMWGRQWGTHSPARAAALLLLPLLLLLLLSTIHLFSPVPFDSSPGRPLSEPQDCLRGSRICCLHC